MNKENTNKEETVEERMADRIEWLQEELQILQGTLVRHVTYALRYGHQIPEPNQPHFTVPQMGSHCRFCGRSFEVIAAHGCGNTYLYGASISQIHPSLCEEWKGSLNTWKEVYQQAPQVQTFMEMNPGIGYKP